MKPLVIVTVAIASVILITLTAVLIIINNNDAEPYPPATDSVEFTFEPSGYNSKYVTITGITDTTALIGDDKNVDLVIPAYVIIGSDECRVVEIGAYSFQNMSGIRSITIPKTVMNIREGAFLGCYNVKKVDIRGHIADGNYGEKSFSLGTDSVHKAEFNIYGFKPVRDPSRSDSDYKDVFGDHTTVHYQIIEFNSKDPLIHTGLLALGVIALLYMGRSVKVKKVDRSYKRGPRV